MRIKHGPNILHDRLEPQVSNKQRRPRWVPLSIKDLASSLVERLVRPACDGRSGERGRVERGKEDRGRGGAAGEVGGRLDEELTAVEVLL